MRDLNVDVDCSDDRQVEAIANRPLLRGGAQLAVDVTLVSALDRHSRDEPRPRRRCWNSRSCRSRGHGAHLVEVAALGKLTPSKARKSGCSPPSQPLRPHIGHPGQTLCQPHTDTHTHLPRCAANCFHHLESEAADAPHCLAEAASARRTLVDRRWSDCPTWGMILHAPSRQRTQALGTDCMDGITTA